MEEGDNEKYKNNRISGELLHPKDKTYLLISVTGEKHLSVRLHTRSKTTMFASLSAQQQQQKKEKRKYIGLHVRADQEFLPSQSGPISWKLTCALTPLRERISEHGNTKSGKRKTLIDFTCFLMCLPQGPAVLKQLLTFPRSPSKADTATVL